MRTILFLSLLVAVAGCKMTGKKAQDTSDSDRINFCGPTTATLDTAPGKDGRLVPLFEGLGDLDFPITTTSELAQAYFNQGLTLSYGFNHGEAARSFREAIRQDSDCAMCYWGLGYVLGPNYNFGMEAEVLPAALEAVENAKLRAHTTKAKEQALISALAKRYPKTLEEDPMPYYEAYAEGMRQAYEKFPNDVDIVAMTAEALMDLHPWDLWKKDGQPQPWIPEILDIIDHALSLDVNHPQANHLKIHAMEAAPNAEEALDAANRLRSLVPGAGHLVHMPSHIYINTGHYHEGTLANVRASAVDSAYVEACHAQGVYPMLLYPHNMHFLAACAALEGQGDKAIEASRYMAKFTLNHELMYDTKWAALQHFYSIPMFIMVKFAKWEEVLQEPLPDEKLVYSSAIWKYARGMAYAGLGDFAKAEQELEQLRALAQLPVVAEMSIWDINTAADILFIAENVLAGDIAQRQGKYDQAVTLLRKAVVIEDQLNYNEPPDWFFSVRHTLGDVLLKAGKYVEAQRIYEEDLQELKENGWALMGLYQCLKQQNKPDEAAQVYERFRKAWQYADVELTSSVI